MQDLLDAGPFTVPPAERWAEALADVDTPEDIERLGLPGPATKASQP
jgi:CTP:molybdopterin cytidylyltransferase MocA